MPEFTTHRPGTFCWIDLATSYPEAAKAFYTKLFAWEAQDVPAGEAGVYTMLNSRTTNSVRASSWRAG